MVRGLKLRQGNGYVVERPLQLVCNLEIGGENSDYKLNPEAEVFVPIVRSSRRTKEIANKLFKDIAVRKLKMVTEIYADKHLNGGRVLRTFEHL